MDRSTLRAHQQMPTKSSTSTEHDMSCTEDKQAEILGQGLSGVHAHIQQK